MTIKELLEILENVKDEVPFQNINIIDYGSDRSDYYNFYIGEGIRNYEYITVYELKNFLRDKVIGKTFRGYKGGNYEMNEDSIIRLGCSGCGSSDIEGILIRENGIHLKAVKILYY